MAEDQNQSDFDELLSIYSEDSTSESESSSDFDELLDIYSEEDVKKKDTTSESPSQDGKLESVDVRVPLDMYKSIDRDLIDRGDEDQVAVDLEKEYGKFGFEFEADGVGDAVRVTKNKGTKEEVTEVFDLDPAWYNLFTSEEGESKRMKEWLEGNTSKEEISTFLRDKSKRFDVDAPDPSRLQVNEAAKTDMFDEPSKDVENFRDKQLKELGFEIPEIRASESYMGETREVETKFQQELREKKEKTQEEEASMAMKLAIGIEEGKVIENITGDSYGAIEPGQDEFVADQTRKIISEKKKTSSEKRYEKGDNNYWANVALNYQELTNPNKYKRTLDEIENDDSFFERTTSNTKIKSSELVRDGLNIAYTSYANERDDLMASVNESLKEAKSIEIKVKESEDKFISGGVFNGSQEDYDKYVADFTELVNIYNGDEFKTLNNLQKNIDATLADYEANPDVNILEANNIIRKRYQERLDSVYKESNFLFLTGMNISQMTTAGAVRGINAIASMANNLVLDEKYDFGDVIEDSLDEFAEVIDLNVGGSSKLKRGYFEKYSNVYGFDVILDDEGNPTGQVYGSDGYLVKSGKSDEILFAYNADPSIFETESKINVGANLYQTLPTMVDMVMTLLPIGGVVGVGARALGAGKKVAAGVGTATGVFVQSHDDFYDAAIEAGASESEAALFGSVQSLGVAVVSMLNPLEAKAVAATMSKASVQNLAKQYVKNIVAGKTRRDAFKLAVEATTKQSLKETGKELAKGAVFEGLEETVGEISADQIISNTWKILGGADVTSEVDFGEAINTFFMAGFASLPFSIISLSAGKGTYRRQMLYGAMNNTDIVRSELEKNKGKAVTDANGVVRRIDDDYINEYVQQLEDLKSATKLYFDNTSINEEDSEVIVDLVARRKGISDEMKNSALDGVSKKAYQEAISKIDEKLGLYINKDSKKPFYVLEGEAISKEDLDKKMSDEDWVSGLKSGRWSLSIYNDPDTESSVKKLSKAALKTEDASDEFETKTKVREAKQEVTDYIGEKISKLKMEQKVDPVLEKVNNAEEINENEVDGAIEALFEEIDNVRESDLSDDAKESIITNLYKQAQTLENYEFTTETKTRTTTKRRPIRVPIEVKKENTKTPQERIKGRKVVRVEGDDFAATVETVEDTQKGKTKKPTRDKGEEVTVIEEAEDGSLLIQNYDSKGNKTTSQSLSASSMNDFELVETTKDEDGNVTGAVLRNKNNDGEAFLIEDADLAMDLAIEKTQAEFGVIEEEVFEETIEEVESLKEQKDDTKTTEQERVDSQKQGREEDTGEVSEQTESETEGETDSVLQEEVEPETQESIKNKIEDLSVKTSKEKNRAVKREALRRVAKVMASLKKKFPDVKFVVHTSQESFAKTDEDLQKKLRKNGDLTENGYFDSNTNTIHINLSTFNGNLDLRTIGHEAFHAVLYNSIGVDTGRVDFSAETKKMLDAVERSGNLGKESMDSLNNLIGKMDLEDFEVDEEFLAEMVGMLSMEQENLSLSARKAVMKWINDVAKKLGISSEIFKGVNSDAELIEMLNTLSKKIGKGDVISDADVEVFKSIDITNEELGESGATGKVKIKKRAIGVKAPSVKEDPRSFASLMEDVDLREFIDQDFLTNMYDYTNAGETKLANGFSLNLFGGKDYVALMMEKRGLKPGDISNLAAFNSLDNTEKFITNAKMSGAKLFMPHSGSLDSSWQFQHAIFEELSNMVLDNDIMSNKDMIDLFNDTLTSKEGKKNFKTFKRNYAEQKGQEFTESNFNQFLDNPKELIELINAENNYGPDLRKIVASKLIAKDKFKNAIGIKNKNQFYDMIMSPLNKGVKGGEIMGVIDFDPNTFEIKKTKKGDVDHHPSFGYTVLAKINGIYQPTEFYQSDEITDSYTKYNKGGKEVEVSTKENVTTRKEYQEALKDTRVYRTNDKGKKVIAKGSAPFVGTFEDFKKSKFRSSNVSSSAGSIPKVATVGKKKFRSVKGSKQDKVWQQDGSKLRKVIKEATDAYLKNDTPQTEAAFTKAKNELREYQQAVKAAYSAGNIPDSELEKYGVNIPDFERKDVGDKEFYHFSIAGSEVQKNGLMTKDELFDREEKGVDYYSSVQGIGGGSGISLTYDKGYAQKLYDFFSEIKNALNGEVDISKEFKKLPKQSQDDIVQGVRSGVGGNLDTVRNAIENNEYSYTYSTFYGDSTVEPATFIKHYYNALSMFSPNREYMALFNSVDHIKNADLSIFKGRTKKNAKGEILPAEREYRVLSGDAIDTIERIETAPKKASVGKKKFRSIKTKEEGYLSNAAEGISKLNLQPSTPDVWIKKITEAGGKGTAQELEIIGLKNYLSAWMKGAVKKSVPKDVVEHYIRTNQKATLVDITMSEPLPEPEALKNLRQKARELQNNLARNWGSAKGDNLKSDLRKVENEISEYLMNEGFQAVQDREDFRKYKAYTMSGGTNYRELLITIPPTANEDVYIPPIDHWGGKENVLAHVRMTDRMLFGEQVLFIDEVQSDWAQAGRTDGFKNEELRKKADKFDADAIKHYKLQLKLQELKEVRSASVDESYYILRKSDIRSWTGLKEFPGETVFVRGDDFPNKETAIPFDQLPDSYKDAWNKIESHPTSKSINRFEKIIEELESKYGTTYDRDLKMYLLKEIEGYKTAFGDVHNMPYKKTEQWAGLAIRRILNLAADEGYNRIAFTTGEQIKKLVGGKLEGQQEFYDKMLPRIVRDEAQRLDKKAKVEVVQFKPPLKRLKSDPMYTPPGSPALDKQVSIEITPKIAEKAKRGVKKFRSIAKETTRNRNKGQSTLVSVSEQISSKDSIIPLFKRGNSITTTLNENKPITVIPVPEKLLRNSPTFNKTVDTEGFMYKLGQEFDYVPGGVYVDVSDFKNKSSINSYVATSGQISIDPKTGKEVLSVSENQPSNITTYQDLKKTQGGNVIMTNLIKRGGGLWNWWNDSMKQRFEKVKKLVSVNTKGQHIYSLSFESTTPIMLKNNISGSEPRLRPTTKGEIFLGEVVGVIRTGSGKEHPVYDRVYSVDPKDTQTLDRLNYKYRNASYDFYKQTIYEKLGQTPPLTLASRQTEAHKFVFDKLGIKKPVYVGGGVEASVYDIGLGRIIRISSERSDVLNKLVNKKIEGVTPVYATGVVELPKRTFGLNSSGEVLRQNEFDDFDNQPRYLKEAPPIYYSIMQKGDPSDSSVGAKLRPLVTKLKMYMHQNGIKKSSYGADIESLIKDLSSEQLQDFINNKELDLKLTDSEKKDFDRIILITNNLSEELGIKRRDSHLGNYIRNSKGELEAIDLGSFGTFEEGFEPQPTVEKNKLKFRNILGGQSNTNLKAAQDLIREESKVSRIRSVKSSVKKLIKGFGDFQFPVKRMLEKAGLEIVSSRLQNIKGAGAFAKLKFDKVRDEIFGKMTVNERYDFDRYITARRAVAANEARNQRIEDADVRSEEYDAIMEREQNGEPILTLGMTPEEMELDILTLENDYPKFKERADKYFDVFSKMLEEDLENGLITQEQYEAMEGINYSPRVFLKYVFNIDGEIDGDPNWKNKLKTDYGMSEENIKKLTVGIKDIGGKNEGFIMDLMMDSEVILANYMNARARKNAMNRTTARLAKDFEGVKQRFDELKDKKKNLASVGKELSNEEVVEFESLQKIMDSFSDKKKKMRGMTSELIYYVDGKRKVMYTTPEIKDMWFDNKDIGIAPNMDKWAGKTGTNILKAMATGINPLFAITNAPRDFVQVLAFTDTYSKTRGASFMPMRMAYLLKDFFKSAYDITMKNENFENAIEDGLMMEFLYKEGRGKDKTFKTTGEKAIDILLAGRKDYLAKKSGKLFGKLLYLNEVSEIGFRMAIRDRVIKERVRELDAEMNKIYEGSFDKDNMTDEQQEMYDQNMEDIRDFATAKARAYMDFSTGGSVIKGLDPALPYLNAAAVGAFASSKYIAENKVKFSVDALQLTAMGTALTAGGSVALMAMFRNDDDDDKDLNNWQLFMREYNRVPSYITDRYHIVFTGRRDDRGGYEYVKIAKNQGLAPFYNIAEGIMFNTFNTQFMKGDGYLGGKEIYSNEDMFFNASRNLFNNYNAFGFDPLDLIKAKEGKKLKAATVMMSKVLTRNPALGGIIELGTNYDLFRGKPITYSKGADYLKPKYQGYRDNNLEKFWIDISRTAGMGSGAEMKFAFEKVLTSPSTNPFIATLYGFAESKSITTEFLSTKQKGGFEQVISQMSKRAFGHTNPNYNPIAAQNKKVIQDIMTDYLGEEEYGRKEILIAFSERLASQLREDKDFVNLLNDPTMSEKSKRLAEEAIIQKSINRSPDLPDYLQELNQDEVSSEEMYEIMTNVVESYNLGTMRGININGYKNAVKYSQSSKELASRVLVELEGMNPYDEDFKDAQEELTRVYKHIKGKGASLPKDFETEYIKAFQKLNEELGNR